MHPQTWTVGLNKINYCVRKGVLYGKNQKDIQRRVQGESGIGNHQRQQEHSRSLPRIWSESGPALTLEISVFEQCPKLFENVSEVDPQQARIAELERLAGKQSLEMEILKNALTLLPQVKKKGES